MPKFEKLESFIREKYGTQGGLAEKLGISQNTVSAWIRGKNRISSEMEKKLRALHYDGPWPQEEAKEKAQPQAGDYITREEFAEWRGYWKAGTEKLLQEHEAMKATLADLARKVAQLEKGASA